MSHQSRIADVQTALNAHGAQLQVDGHMGPKTKAALSAYQRQHKLKVTGQPNSATLKSLGI
jgi:peptidoglycan hydrolase-like protein with peptidoglycan-binding domain